MKTKILVWLAIVCGAVALLESQGRAAQAGSVVGWGSEVMPFVQPGTHFTKIAAGYFYNLALKSDGTVVAWGLNYGQITVPGGLNGVVAIAVGGGHSLALKFDGTVVAWGQIWNGSAYITATAPGGLNGVVAIAAGDIHSLALKYDGTVVAWGDNSSGQTTVPSGLTGVVAIAAGSSHSLALKQNGTVVAWGSNSDGQSTVPTGLNGVVSISAGSSLTPFSAGGHSLALKQDGTVVAWGSNAAGAATVPSGLSGVIAIAAGSFAGVGAPGTIGAHSLALKQDGTIVAWGNNDFGQTIVPGGLTGVIAIAAEQDHVLALKQDGTVVVAWGGSQTPGGQTAVPSGLNGVVAIAAGDRHGLALKSDGTLVVWGDTNSYGQGTVPSGLNGVAAIAAGYRHSLALKFDGTVVAWGQIWNGSAYITATAPGGLNGVVAIAAGINHSLALKSDGTVVAWGQIWNGSAYITATAPGGLNGVVAIAAGDIHSLALKYDGTVVAWGDNYYGQSTVPGGLSGVAAIAAGYRHSLALKSDGTLVPWGDNSYGQSTVPGGLDGVVAIAAGGSHSLVLVVPSNQSPSILGQPVSVFRRVGENATFSVTANGQPPLRYQWHSGTGILANATNSSLSLTNVQFVTAGGYSVVVTNSFGSVTSTVAQLTVYTNLVLTQTNRAPTTNEIGQPTIPTDPTHFKVYTNGNFQSGVALNPNKMTVVITHGWNGTSMYWPGNTAHDIGQRIGASTVNIVAWDWTAEAQSEPTGLARIAAKTPGQGRALGTNLVAALGANYTQRIHFIGHSLGTLVNGHAADYVHAHGFSWTNTQMTLCDEAEAAWELNSTGWQMATTLPQTIGQVISSLSTLNGNFSTPQRYWDRPLPKQFAWADNYISAIGLLHPDAANAILTWDYPQHGSSDFAEWASDWALFHAFSHNFYEDTIVPGWYQTGGRTNATYMGFICSFEGGGTASRPAANTVFYQNPVGYGYELDLVPTTLAFATNFLNDRFRSVLWTARETGENYLENRFIWNPLGQAVGQVSGLIDSVGNGLNNLFVNLRTGLFPSALTEGGSVGPAGGPGPTGGGGNNTPAYAWIPLEVPSNVVSMSFDFMLQGNGNQDSFQVALRGTNILSLETSLIQTNVTQNSGLIGISQYAGQHLELFLGVVGGTSTNVSLSVSNFQFYATSQPALRIQLAGTNAMLTWPLSGAGYVLQSANQLTPPISWTTLTNVPVIVDFQYTVTNQISGGSRFYRLAKASTASPALQAQVSGNNFILAWPSSVSGYALETTTNLAATNSWTAVTNTPALVNQQYVVTNQVSGAARFYRLRK